MKELFQLLAEYNAKTNVEMIGILEKLPPERLAQDAGSFYRSILGLVNHILVSDVIWLGRFAHQFPELAFVEPRLPQLDMQKWTDIVWGSLAAYRPVRLDLDETIRQLFQRVADGSFGAELAFKNMRGVDQNKIAWRAFLHFFNHQTHHRGQVAVLLDQFQVENDYSNLIWKF
jgi:uncharacterized damage-inducible protein DinB